MNTTEQTARAGFEQDGRDYWAMRDTLLAQYFGKWVAVHKGNVIAVSDDMLDVMHAHTDEGYAYCNLVGLEDKVVVRKRHAEFVYDESYAPIPLPRVSVTLHNSQLGNSASFDDVIPDTGADLSCWPAQDLRSLGLTLFQRFQGVSKSFGAAEQRAEFYPATVEIGRVRYRAVIEAVDEQERLLGRDVLNQMVITFDGPGRKVIIATPDLNPKP